MNKTENYRSPKQAAPGSGPPSSADDPRVAAALEEYLAACEAGRKPARAAFLARHPEIAEALAGCLAGLDLIQSAVPDLGEASDDPRERPPLHSGAPIGDFRIVRLIGRGGMGVVYEAEQLS